MSKISQFLNGLLKMFEKISYIMTEHATGKAKDVLREEDVKFIKELLSPTVIYGNKGFPNIEKPEVSNIKSLINYDSVSDTPESILDTIYVWVQRMTSEDGVTFTQKVEELYQRLLNAETERKNELVNNINELLMTPEEREQSDDDDDGESYW